MYRFFVCLLFITVGNTAYADSEYHRRKYENIYEVPRFIQLHGKASKTDFMKRVLDNLQVSLAHSMRPVKFMDKQNNVTRETLEKYKKTVSKNIAKKQRRDIEKLDEDRDGEVSFLEYAAQGGYDEADSIVLYESVKKYGIYASEKNAPIIQKMEKTQSQKISTLTFLKDTLRLFIELDQNSDGKLSKEEINTPAPSTVFERSADVIAQFEAYLSLSKDGKSTNLDQINEVAQKAFNTLDINENGQIDMSEYSFYLRAHLPKASCNIVPTLNNDNEHTYVIATYGSNVSTSIQFTSGFGGFTGYIEVEIEKQEKPLNLILSSIDNIVWAIKGDINSLADVIIFAHGGDRQVNAGVIGVPKEKITFANRKDCFDFNLPGTHNNKVQNEEIFNNSRGLTKYLTGNYPHLLRTQSITSRIVVKSQPEIEFYDDINESLTKAPDGYNNAYWEQYLKWKTAGYKPLNLSNIHTGGYAYEPGVLPSWAGIAGLEHDGIIKTLNVDFESRKAVFLLEKDLPEFPGTQNSNPPEFTFIMDKDTLKFPEPIGNKRSSGLCMMSRQGDVKFGKRYCTMSDLAFLNTKTPRSQSLEQEVVLSLPKFLPVMPAYKDSIHIELEIDKKVCKEKYKEEYTKKCKIPDHVTNKPIPVYALDLVPPVSGKLSWENENTLEFIPEEAWDVGQLYTMSINLDTLNMPEGVNLNNGRVATTQFFADKARVQASNLSIKDDPNEEGVKILTADLKSNYPLRDVSFNVMHVPDSAVQPDEHIYIGDKGYKNIGIRLETDIPDFSMLDMKRQLKLYVYKHPDNLEPTHLNIVEPISSNGSEIFAVRPIWLSLKGDDSEKLSPEVKKIYADAKAGQIDAQLKLAKIYQKGKQAPKSLSRQRKWLMAAANQGNVEAYTALGNLNVNKHALEFYDIEEAFIWLSKAAGLGDKDAQYRLARVYGANDSIYSDREKMMELYESTAEQDYIPSINQLGYIFENGYYDFEVDYKKALKYYEQAEKLKDDFAFTALSRFYYKGYGVQKDLQKSYAYAKKAIELGTRDDQKINSIASWYIANILLEKYNNLGGDLKIKGIADKVFKDFKKDYSRMWIADQIADEWGGDYRILSIASEILARQEEITPNLEELRFVKAEILLKSNYYNRDQYNPVALKKAIKIMEGLQDNDFFDRTVFNRLVYLYLSRGGYDVREFIERHRIEKYYTLADLSWARSYFQEYTNRITEDMENSKDPDIRNRVAQADKEADERAPNVKKWYLKQIEKYPESAWAHGNFASFLLRRMGDYDGAIKYGEKALSIMDYPMARGITGLAYLVKASQLFKDKKTSDQAPEYLNKAKAYGLDKWYIKDNCDKFCEDIAEMLKAYREENSKVPI